MSDQLDDDLKRRISEVFDNYEDDSADEGWMLLREKFPEQSKHRGTAWLWWASAAAVFLLVLGLGLWIRFDGANTETNNYAVKLVKPAQQPNKTEDNIKPVIKQVPATGNDQLASTGGETRVKQAFRPAAPALVQQTNVSPVQPNAIDSQTFDSREAIASAKTTATAGTDSAAIIANAKVQPVYAVTQQPQVNAPTVATQQPAVNDQPAAKQQPVVTTQPAVKQEPEKSAIEKLFEREQRAMASNTKKTADSKNEDKLVHFGVYAGTYVNYAKGSDNQVNVGAGLTSDFKLTKKLRFSTGVSIAQNSMSYGTEIPKVAAQASLMATAVREQSFSGITAPPEFKDYNASLVGLDIPLNLKYEFNPSKSDTYISAGVSSGTFINESYNYRFSYSAPFSYANNQTENENINKSFNNFYFAKTLNFAFGVGYPLGKSNRLVIEPFVKYPLAGLGAQQIRFGAGGVNLKLNFQTRRK
ncbi:hypothetical protein GCM10023149_52720 [Mucilaginibacter gynuensis]|uniref:Outer membrane protein with beta-barrel domain n=1 Tax=Mucilaginibacter gynuensis TaxID=1302236 RepID=A0ABP8HL97_9SPHI